MFGHSGRPDPVGCSPLFIMDLAGYSSLTFCDSLKGEEVKRRGSGSDDVYCPEEGCHI